MPRLRLGLPFVVPFLLVFGMLTWLSHLTQAQNGLSASGPQLGSKTACCGGSGSAVGLRELDFPYYSLRDGFSSQLNLVSDSPEDNVTITTP
jgi:hypothetical protein